MFNAFHLFPSFFHWFSFMCFTIFIIFIFPFFFPGCIGFFRCEPSFFAWHVLGLKPSARQFNRNPDVLDDDDNDDDGDNDVSMVFIDFSMVFISFSLAPIYVFSGFIFFIGFIDFSWVFSLLFYGWHRFFHGFHCLHSAKYSLAPPKFSHLRLLLTCASNSHLCLGPCSLAPPVLTGASTML